MKNSGILVIITQTCKDYNNGALYKFGKNYGYVCKGIDGNENERIALWGKSKKEAIARMNINLNSYWTNFTPKFV